MNPPPPPPPNQSGNNQHPPPPAHAEHNFFGKPPEPKKEDHSSSQFAETSRRLRMVEESLSNLRKKVELDEENNLRDHKKKTTDLQTLYKEIDGLKDEQSKFKNEMLKMVKEFQTLAKKEDVQVLQKYIELWEPLKYATIPQVERMIKETIGESVNRTPQKFEVPEIESAIEKEESQEENSHNSNTKESEEDNDIENDDQVYQHKEEVADEEPEQTTKHDPNAYLRTHSMYAQTEPAKTQAHKEHMVTAEQKKMIAQFLEEYEDAREMLLKQPDKFEERASKDPQLKSLFRGINIKELSDKLRPHYE